MIKGRILVIGSSGFVGKNIAQFLSDEFEIMITSRNPEIGQANTNTLYFDLTNRDSYKNIVNNDIDVIINCAGYGVVKTERDIDTIYNINYLATTSFFDFLSMQMPQVHLIHIGTAFEYDLSIKAINEQSNTLPRTHYGISKLMASKYLLEKNIIKSYQIIRPFSMFGQYEDNSKIIPSLILAQKNTEAIPLSSGLQMRDYLFVEDLAAYIKNTLKSLNQILSHSIINIGSSLSISIKSLAELLVPLLPYYEPQLWQWGKFPSRENESDEFYNESALAVQSGLNITPLISGFERTINYYWNL